MAFTRTERIRRETVERAIKQLEPAVRYTRKDLLPAGPEFNDSWSYSAITKMEQAGILVRIPSEEGKPGNPTVYRMGRLDVVEKFYSDSQVANLLWSGGTSDAPDAAGPIEFEPKPESNETTVEVAEVSKIEDLQSLDSWVVDQLQGGAKKVADLRDEYIKTKSVDVSTRTIYRVLARIGSVKGVEAKTFRLIRKPTTATANTSESGVERPVEPVVSIPAEDTGIMEALTAILRASMGAVELSAKSSAKLNTIQERIDALDAKLNEVLAKLIPITKMATELTGPTPVAEPKQ